MIFGHITLSMLSNLVCLKRTLSMCNIRAPTTCKSGLVYTDTDSLISTGLATKTCHPALSIWIHSLTTQRCTKHAVWLIKIGAITPCLLLFKSPASMPTIIGITGISLAISQWHTEIHGRIAKDTERLAE